MYCVPDTRLTLWHPARSSESIMDARSAGVRSRPCPSWLHAWFWQYTQASVHRLKKTTPEPDAPEMGGSSPWWTMCR